MKFQLRIIDQDDWRELLKLISSNYERLKTYFPQTVAAIVDEESTKTYVNKKVQDAANKVSLFHVITDSESAKIVGCIHVKEIDWNVPKAELSYFIDQSVEGKGIISKYLKEVVRNCFEHTGLEKVFVRINPENAASKKVALKCGFEKEGYFRCDFRSGEGELKNSEYYGLLKSEFIITNTIMPI